MPTWSFYKKDTGRFTGESFSGSARHLEGNTPPGCTAMPGSYDRFSVRVDPETGRVVPSEDEEARWSMAELQVRNQRATLIRESDWTQIPDSPLEDELRAKWRVYRQALRDITEQPGFPLNVTWPAPPAP